MIIEEKICAFLKDKPHLISVHLFGSYAQNKSTDKSDVDIGVLFDYNHIPLSLR